jgi:hypothetical protein
MWYALNGKGGGKMKTMKALLKKKEVVEIREKFMSVDTRSLDSKHRITLGGRLQRLMMSKMRIDSYKVFVGKCGDILLRPAVSIPSSEAWVYNNPEVIGKVRKGLQEAGEGKAEKVNDLEGFLNDL